MEDIKKFIQYLEVQKNYSPLTTDSYYYILEHYYHWVNTNIKQKTWEITKNQIKQYIYYLNMQQYTPATIAKYISTLKSFYKYLIINKKISKDYNLALEYPKKSKKLPQIMYEREIKEFFQQIDKKQKFGKRNYSLFLVLYTTGIRVEECSNLKIEDIDFIQSTIKVLGKGQKERIVPLHYLTQKEIENYINTERNILLHGEQSEYLFINNKNSQLTARGIRHITTKIAQKCSNHLKISPHTFRHTLATKLLNNGMDLRYIQEILGHSNLATTEVYTHLDVRTLNKTYQDKIKR